MVPRLLDPFLHPSSSLHLSELQKSVSKGFDDLTILMRKFTTHRTTSQDDRMVQGFIENFYRAVIARLKTFRDLLGIAPIPTMIQFAEDPAYISDIERLLKRTNETLLRLVKEPSKNTESKKHPSIRSLKAQGKIRLSPPIGPSPPTKAIPLLGMERTGLNHRRLQKRRRCGVHRVHS